MNLNATLFAQFVVFFILALFTMKFVWPPLIKALDERAKKISDGLEAADRGHAELAFAETRVQVQLAHAHEETQKRLVMQSVVQLKSWMKQNAMRWKKQKAL